MSEYEDLIKNLNDIDENDLCLDDLDDDGEDVDKKQNNKTEDTSEKISATATANVANNNNDDEDELLFKVPINPVAAKPTEVATKETSRTQKVSASTNFTDDENDEDEFIRSQPIFSSTQSALDLDADGFKIPAIPPSKSSLNPSSEDVESKSDELISTQLVRRNQHSNEDSVSTWPHNQSQTNKTQTATASNNNTSVIELLDNKEVWNYSFGRLCELFIKDSSKGNMLKKLTIEHYMNRMIRFNLWRLEGETVPQLPLICLYINEISRAKIKSHAQVVLADDKSLLRGIIHSSIAKEHWNKLSVGSVLLLKNISLIRAQKKLAGYYTWITIENLIYIYYKDKIDDKIRLFKYNEIDMSEIEKLVSEFNKNYGSHRLVLNSSSSTTSTTLLNNVTTNTTSSISTVAKSTSSTTATSARLGTSVASVAPTRDESRSQVVQQTPRSTPTQQPQQRVFTFRSTNTNTSAKSNSEIRSYTNLDSSITCLQSSTQNAPTSHQNKSILSEEQLSQLIFGLEDEF